MSIIRPHDLPTLRKSCQILASCLEHVRTQARAGMSVGLLNDFAESFILSYGAKPAFKNLYGYPYTLISELNEEVVHGMSPREKLIPEKCVISFDCGVVYKGLYSDMCILMTFGDVDSETIRLVETTKESLWAGIKQVKAGKRVGDIGAAVDKVIQREKLGNVLELGGHGLGYKPHDEPHITHAGYPNKGAKLFENQVIAIEPMVTLGSGKVDFVPVEGSGIEIVMSKERCWSAHIEHSVLVTKTGYEVLTDISTIELLPIIQTDNLIK
jgi:methionyl aminopeptidase